MARDNRDDRGPGRIDRLDRDRAALVVIDAQNDFCHRDGLQARQGHDVAQFDQPLENLGRLMSSARAHGVPVYLIQNIHTDETDTVEWLERHPDQDRAQNCQADSWGAEFCGFAPQDGDTVITKHRYSAFIRTSLEEQLREAGRSSLLFAGFTTATCVESSLRDAVCLDFVATLVEDCCGAYSAEAHQRAVQAMTTGFGEVRSSHEVIDHWNRVYGVPGARTVGAA